MGESSLLFGSLPSGSEGEALALRLLLWALPWLGAALFGLWRATSEFWRAFWLMSGLWALMDGFIAFFGILGGEPELGQLRQILYINVGLDVLYLLVAVYLYTRPRPMLKGFGVAVAIQGFFLLWFDLFHALQI